MNESSLRNILAKLGVQVQGKSGDWLRASCPFSSFFHSSGKDSHPSFTAKIDPDDDSFYYCHACKMHGRISALARALGHHRHNNQFYYSKIIEESEKADKENIVFPDYEKIHEPKDPPQEPLVEEIFDNMYMSPSHCESLMYLTYRGISLQTALSLGLRWDERQRRILFPVRNPKGELMGFSGRATGDQEPKIRDYAGLKKRQHILGSHRWEWGNRRKPLIIVEGLFGYAHLVELGVEKVADVGALLGSSLTNKKRDLIIDRNTRTILLVDDDEAGDLCLFGRNNDGAINKLSKQGFPVYVPLWPKGKDDPDSLSKHEIWQIIQGNIKERYND
jgi:DNA primase